MTDYIDYMLMNIYIGNVDWPFNNFYAGINTADPTGFEFFRWDSEISLGLISGVNSLQQLPQRQCYGLLINRHVRWLAGGAPDVATTVRRAVEKPRTSTWPSPTRRGSSSSTAAR